MNDEIRATNYATVEGMMITRWPETTIGEQVLLQRGIDITRKSQRAGPVPVISSGGVSSFHDVAAAKGPGVVLGRKGVIGSVWYVDTDYWPHDTTLWVRDFRGNDPRFVYYFFKCRSVDLARLDVGSANPTLNRNHVHPTRVQWPPITEQHAIARILGSIDDKIELHRKTSETLEAMARALFKSWFIDFDPVRARAEGRAAGMDAETASLFPQSFFESALGKIPESWSVTSIGELAEVVGGSTPSTAESRFWDNGTHHWVTPKDLSVLATPVITTTERKLTDQGLAQIGSGLLPRGTVLLSSRAPIGYLGITEVPVAINQGFIAMKPLGGTPGLFLLRWAETALDEIVSRANGSTFLEISKSNFRPIRLVRPTAAVLSAFQALAEPLYRHVVSNERESTLLAQLRDSILPRLLSGELSVADVEGLA